jgi:hypothetical protein
MAAKLKIEKRGDEIKKKKSSPLKLLNQFQPNFAEMILLIIMLIQFKFGHFLA